MSRQIALIIYVFFILLLLARDRKIRPMTSSALWIPLLWLLIITSKPVSAWFGGGQVMESPDDYLDGSPLDRNVYLLLMLSGLVVLFRRDVSWGRMFSTNRWLFALFFYWLLSVFWSEYYFVSLKRWIKDLGNVVMVLIIVTEGDPIQALRAVFVRWSNILLPVSVLFIKYYPELGRYYDRATWEHLYCGATIEKNGLGCLAFLSGLVLAWDLIEMRTIQGRKKNRLDLLSRFLLMLMVFWLLDKAVSITAIVCFILGIGILFLLRRPIARKQVRYLGTYSLMAGLVILLLYSVPGILESFVGMVGRDMTLTGRTHLWEQVLREPIDPLLGTGYQSFWLGSRMEYYQSLWNFRPNQAHNGYLETYLNGGLIGVCLLMAMIISAGGQLKKELLLGSSLGILRFSFFVIVLIYNWTEAMYNKMSPIWFVFLIAILTYACSPRTIPEDIASNATTNKLLR